MDKDDFLIHKESFIKSRRENILHFYDFYPKVSPFKLRNSAKEHMELSIRPKKKGLRTGEQ
jgi:hypothetical protein